jgi:DNA-binding transcriptional ArsR family regulator
MSDEHGSAPAPAGPIRQEPIYAVKAEFFRVIGHPARVRILELLRDGERSVGELQAELRLDSSGTSQHLGVLRRLGVLESRKEGTSVYYRVRDPRTFQLLEVARQIITSSLEATQALLTELSGTGAGAGPGSSRR